MTCWGHVAFNGCDELASVYCVLVALEDEVVGIFGDAWAVDAVWVAAALYTMEVFVERYVTSRS